MKGMKSASSAGLLAAMTFLPMDGPDQTSVREPLPFRLAHQWMTAQPQVFVLF